LARRRKLSLKQGQHEQHRAEISAFGIDSRQSVLFGVHLIGQVPKGPRRSIAEAREIRLPLGPDNGHDPVFVSHHHHESSLCAGAPADIERQLMKTLQERGIRIENLSVKNPMGGQLPDRHT
jgi:hypothetical protein